MSVVWKYAVPMPDERGRSFVDMHFTATPISIGLQEGEMVVWALVDLDAAVGEDQAETGPVRLIVANTGQDIPEFPDGAAFLGTVTSAAGIVWHVWNGDAETTA
jgi:hypothetical protein